MPGRTRLTETQSTASLRWLHDRDRVLPGLWITAVFVVSIQAFAHHSNNFEIFRTSWFNLAAGRDLYALSTRYSDVFLYSPTFALLFAPLALLPTWLGILLWNGVNAFALYWGLGRILAPEQAFVARLIVFMDAIVSMQSAESNGLVAGLVIVAFAELERRQQFRAALTIICGTAIKVFPIAAAVFALRGPSRLSHFVVYCSFIGAVFVGAVLPLMSPAQLLHQYGAWAGVMGADDGGYSIMNLIRLWIGGTWAAWPVQVAGVMALVLPLVRRQSMETRQSRLLFLASVLMFCVLFNHGAESATFVIAVAGIAIWFSVTPRSRFTWTVLGVVVVGTILSSSSAMPAFLRVRFFQAYRIKTLPVLFVWLVTQAQLWTGVALAPRPNPELAGVPARRRWPSLPVPLHDDELLSR